MDYSPKLKKIMQQIKNILDAEDVAGVVVIHEPGFSEYLNRITPKYACLSIETAPDPKTGEPLQGIRMRALESELGKEKRDKVIGDTANMLVHLNNGIGRIGLHNMQVQQLFETKFEIIKGDDKHSSDTTQNS
jgi:hypothetical protein